MTSNRWRYKLEELLEDHFQLYPDSESPSLPKGFEKYKFGGWCCSNKVFEKAKFYDEHGKVLSKERAIERCTLKRYPFGAHRNNPVMKVVQQLEYFVQGVEQLRVCRAFETVAVNVVTEEREYGHTIHSDTVVVRADFQQIPTLHIEGVYKNPSFWRQFNRWNRKGILAGKDHQHSIRIVSDIPRGLNDRKFHALLNLYAEDMLTKLEQVARGYARSQKDKKWTAYDAAFIDRGSTSGSMLPRASGNIGYPDWYPAEQRQFKGEPFHYLHLGLYNLYQRKILDKDFNSKLPMLHIYLKGPSAKKDAELVEQFKLKKELDSLEEADGSSAQTDKRRQERKEEIRRRLGEAS